MNQINVKKLTQLKRVVNDFSVELESNYIETQKESDICIGLVNSLVKELLRKQKWKIERYTEKNEEIKARIEKLKIAIK